MGCPLIVTVTGCDWRNLMVSLVRLFIKRTDEGAIPTDDEDGRVSIGICVCSVGLQTGRLELRCRVCVLLDRSIDR